MKSLAILAAALLVAILAYQFSFHTASHSCCSLLETSDGEMQWLRREFHLNDAQFERIKALHQGYQPRCAELCARVEQANERLQSLAYQSRSVTPELQSAVKESMTVQQDCRSAMLGHIYAVSAEMNPEDGTRYVRMMLPHVIQPSLAEQTGMKH